MALTSSYPSIDIPNTDIWGHLFEREVPWPQDKVLFTNHSSSESYTLPSLSRTSSSLGRSLRANLSLQTRDVVAIFAPNSVHFPATVLGILWAGCIPLPINPAYGVEELEYQLKDASAKAIVAGKEVLEVALEASRRVGLSRERILIAGGPGGDEEKSGVLTVGDFKELGIRGGEAEKLRRVPSRPNDVALLVYSSGTTGMPKGVMLTHRNLVGHMSQVAAVVEDQRWQEDTLLAVLPFFHIFGLMMLMFHPINIGLKVVVLPRFTLLSFCEAVQQHRITYAYVVPPILLALSNSPETISFDLSSLKKFMSAAAPLPPELLEQVSAKLKVAIKQAYGLSETSPGITYQRIQEWKSTIGSVGRLLPNVTVKFMSPSGELVPVGSVGEIWAKGPNVFPGYLNNPTATAAALTEDGYFRTGDAGYRDKDGNIYISDRIKELIKYKGFQVAPAELEGIILKHDKVADVCVIGVYLKSEATEVPLAFVVPSEMPTNAAVLKKEIQEWVKERVVGYKQLRGGVRFVEQIPKNPSGKILRRVLRERASKEEQDSQAATVSRPKL